MLQRKEKKSLPTWDKIVEEGFVKDLRTKKEEDIKKDENATKSSNKSSTKPIERRSLSI